MITFSKNKTKGKKIADTRRHLEGAWQDTVSLDHTMNSAGKSSLQIWRHKHNDAILCRGRRSVDDF